MFRKIIPTFLAREIDFSHSNSKNMHQLIANCTAAFKSLLKYMESEFSYS
jgi:hypothetical protein